jgi:hypothetical protein
MSARKNRSYRRFCLPLRHQYRRGCERPEVVEYASQLPGSGVCRAQPVHLLARHPGEDHCQGIGTGLNRVVVASCTPRTHEPLIPGYHPAGRVKPHLFELANIREQDAWVHRANHEVATEKAKQLVSMAVAKASHLKADPARHIRRRAPGPRDRGRPGGNDGRPFHCIAGLPGI